MRGPLSVLAGLVLGVIVAGLVLGGIVAFAPEATVDAPSPVAVATPTTSPSIAPSPSLGSATPSVAASPSGSAVRFKVGEPAPALSIPQVGGGTIDLASLKGQPVWLDFMTTSCQTCKAEFPLMNSFATRYAKDGLAVIAVDVREDEGAVVAFAEALGATFPFGLDSDGSAAQAWDATTLPTHFWIDKDGIIRDGALGGIGANDMVQALEKIMPGVDVTT